MGRKVDMKKIEDITKCQVTFSKRRSSLMKKAHEISLCCDADVAFVTFSPSGRISKFSSHRRIEDVIHRFINLPPDRRYIHIKNVQEKLHQLDHIKGDTSKLQYLDKQIENLELQIKKGTLELQILEADIRDYEPLPEQEPSLHQLLWCERNLKQSLEKVAARKNALSSRYPSSKSQPRAQVEKESQCSKQLACNFGARSPSWLNAENPCTGQLLMELDPWISPYSAKVRESIFQDLVDKTKRPPTRASTNHNYDFPTKNQSGISSTAQESQIPPPIQGRGIGQTAPFEVQKHQQPHNYGHQEGMVGYSNIAPSGFQQHSSSLTFANHLNKQDTAVPTALPKSNLGRSISPSVNSGSFFTTSTSPATAAFAKGLNLDGLGLQQAPEASMLDSLPLEQDNVEDKNLWTNGIQESGLWEWDDLVMVDNLNLEDLENFF